MKAEIGARTKLPGSPSSSASQPQVRYSSSVAAGPVRQSMALALTPAASSSPRIPAAAEVLLK